MVGVFRQLLLSPFHLVYNRRPLRGSGLPFRGCRSVFGFSVIVHLYWVRAAPFRWGPSVAGSHGRAVLASCWCSASWVRLLWRVKRQAARPQVSCSGGRNSAPVCVRHAARAAAYIPFCHSPPLTPDMSARTGTDVRVAGFRHSGAGASLRDAAVTTCRWR